MIGYKNRPDNNRFIERRGCWMTGFGSQNLLSPNRALTRNSNSSQCCGLPVKHSRQVTLFGPRSPSHAQTLTSRMGTAGPRSTPAVGNALPTTVDPVQHAAAIIPEEQKRPATVRVFSVASIKSTTGLPKRQRPVPAVYGLHRAHRARGGCLVEQSPRLVPVGPKHLTGQFTVRQPLVSLPFFVSWFSPFSIF